MNLLPELCAGYFDAVTSINDQVFIFKNNLVWRLDANLYLLEDYPMEIGKLFPILELNQWGGSGGIGGTNGIIVDAAYQRQTDMAVVLLVGHRYWTFNGTDFQLMSPSTMDRALETGTIWTGYGLAETVTHIDAVFVWPKNQKTYIFSGDSFWRYDERLGQLDEMQGRSMSRWNGIPFNVDAVLSLPRIHGTIADGQTLFFKGNAYWQFNDHWVRPEIGYPRLISSLLRC